MDLFQKMLEKTGVYGEVVKIQYPLVIIKGLPKVKPYEKIIFENGGLGMVFDIDQNFVTAVVFSENNVLINSQVTPLNEPLTVPSSLSFLGKVLDPLGADFFTHENFSNFKATENISIFKEAPSMELRASIKDRYLTGQMKVDLLVPLGKGQRELILGDNKTGKTTFVLSVMENQIKINDSIVIYCAVGKKNAEILSILKFIKEKNIEQKTIVIATSASSNSGLVYICPYASMSIAEYFMQNNHNVTLILDDLSTHAKRYRELALLSKRFPGRESYPGDIFYAHASLLERAGNFKTHDTNQSFSITCLPIANTVEGDITGYISTNLMSITDGHILFDADIYNKGQRPAINLPLSVTRVGRQTQSNLEREITVEIFVILSKYEKMKNITHLGAEVSEEAKKSIQLGVAIENILQQEISSIPKELQTIIFAYVLFKPSEFQTQNSYHLFFNKLVNIYNDLNGKEEFLQLSKASSIKELLVNLKNSTKFKDL